MLPIYFIEITNTFVAIGMEYCNQGSIGDILKMAPFDENVIVLFIYVDSPLHITRYS